MTNLEITNALAAFNLQEDIWLGQLEPWKIFSTVCVQSTYHVYLHPYNEYRFNSSNQCLEIGIKDSNDNIKVVRCIDYGSIKCFVGTHINHRDVHYQKSFR